MGQSEATDAHHGNRRHLTEAKSLCGQPLTQKISVLAPRGGLTRGLGPRCAVFACHRDRHQADLARFGSVSTGSNGVRWAGL